MKKLYLVAALLVSLFSLSSEAEVPLPIYGGEGPHPLCLRETGTSCQPVMCCEVRRCGRVVTTTYYVYAVSQQSCFPATFGGGTFWLLAQPEPEGYVRRRLWWR